MSEAKKKSSEDARKKSGTVDGLKKSGTTPTKSGTTPGLKKSGTTPTKSGTTPGPKKSGTTPTKSGTTPGLKKSGTVATDADALAAERARLERERAALEEEKRELAAALQQAGPPKARPARPSLVTTLAPALLFLAAVGGTFAYLNRAPVKAPEPGAPSTPAVADSGAPSEKPPEGGAPASGSGPTPVVVHVPEVKPSPVARPEGDARPDEPAKDWMPSLAKALAASKRGEAGPAQSAFDEAQAAGAPEGELAKARARLESDRKLGEKIAAADALAAGGDLAGAAVAASALEETARELGTPARVQELIARIDAARKGLAGAAEAEQLLAKAAAKLDEGEVGHALLLLEKAKKLAPDSKRVLAFERRVARAQRAPAGLAWVELDAASGAGLYVRRQKVANDEYKAWLDALPVGKRRAAPWPGTDFPAGQATKPVTGVQLDDATAFALAHVERLPDMGEREQLRKALALPDEDGEPTVAGGVFTNGFRTVLDESALDAHAAGATSAGGSSGPVAEVRRVDPRVVEKVKERVADWLTRRSSLRCGNCNGKTTTRCDRCDGRGTERVFTDPAHRPPCKACAGKGNLPCDKCVNGISKTLVESVKKRFGTCGPPITAFTEKSILVTLEADARSGTVTVEVKDANKEPLTETSSWEVDAKGAWTTTGVASPKKASSEKDKGE